MKKKDNKFIKSCTISSLLFCCISQVHAQQRPPQGNPVETLPQVTSPKPENQVKVQVQKEDDNLKKLLSTQINCTHVNIQGVHAIDFKEVAAIFQGFAGKTITVGQLVEAGNKVTLMYKDKGYPLSFAFIPNQDFSQGIVNVTIVEGYVGKVEIKGDAGAAKNHIVAIAEQLEKSRPLKQKDFERVINLLAQQPGMQISANVAPPQTTDGQTSIVLDVKHKALSVGWGIQNVSSGLQGMLTLTESGLTPLDEQITLSTLIPKGNYDREYYGLNYNQPIGVNGLMFKLDAFHYRGDPQSDPLLALGYNARYFTDLQHIGVSLSYPFILDNHRNLTVSTGIYEDDSSDEYVPYVLAPNLNIASHVRVVKIETSYTAQSDKEAHVLSLGLYQGINGLGASQDKAGIDLGFFRTRIQATEAYQFAHDFGIKASGVIQYSSSRLPSTEQISFGGTFFGAGYPAGEVAGDKGWGISGEVNKSFTLGYKYLKTIQPYIGADNAEVLSNSGPLVHRHLASTALGVRLSDKNHYTLDLSVAQPVADKPIDSNHRSPRFNLLYSYQLP